MRAAWSVRKGSWGKGACANVVAAAAGADEVDVEPPDADPAWRPEPPCGASALAKGVVAAVGSRTVLHPAGQVGRSSLGGLIERIELPPADEYYLDYTLTFRPEFDWDKRRRGGKLPGLAGGTGTGGCRPIAPDGWSARQTWHQDGTASLYLYHQDRKASCGDRIDYRAADGGKFHFVRGREYRITERVRVNTPDAHDGEVQVWVDGAEAVDEKGLRLRGDVDPSNAKVSEIKYHSYFGGGPRSAPSHDSYIDYGPMQVLTQAPDFAAPIQACR